MSEVRRWTVADPEGKLSEGTKLVLASDYDAAVRERDIHAERLSLALAERDRLKATLEWVGVAITRIRNNEYFDDLKRPHTGRGREVGNWAAELIERAIAETGPTQSRRRADCPYCKAEVGCFDALSHGYGRCVERRKGQRRQPNQDYLGRRIKCLMGRRRA